MTFDQISEYVMKNSFDDPEIDKIRLNRLVYYMNLPYRMEIVPDKDEGGYAAYFPDLPGCITCADTYEDTVRNAEDAKLVWLDAAIQDGIQIKKPGK